MKIYNEIQQKLCIVKCDKLKLFIMSRYVLSFSNCENLEWNDGVLINFVTLEEGATNYFL